MKQSDIAMLVLIISISLVGSYFLGNAVFGGDKARSTEVEVVQAITEGFPTPDPKVFRQGAVNLTQNITIGESTSDVPFGSDTN